MCVFWQKITSNYGQNGRKRFCFTGLAYALLASLSPIVGLYTSFLPVLIYFVLGTSRHLAVGTFAIISTMVGEVCDREVTKHLPGSMGNLSLNSSTGDNLDSSMDDAKLQIAISLTLLVGIIQAAMGLVHLGFITVYLSRPLVSGFTTGAAFIVFTSQVKYFFGMKPPSYAGAFALPKTYIYIFKNISETNVAALLTGIICVILLALVDYLNRRYQSRLPFPIPSQLLVIIIGSFVSHQANLNSAFDVSVVGSIPRGLPPFSVPKHKYFTDLIVDALLISIVAATTNLSLVKLFSQKHEYKTDSNQELLAYGTVNIISSFFSSFVSSGSLSRSVVQESMGKTQIASLISSFVILLVLLFIAPLFEPLPKPVLAAIVVVSLRKLFMQFEQLKTIGRISIIDAMVWLISCFAVILLGIVMGLNIGFGITLLSIIHRSSHAKVKTLGHLRQTDLYRDRELCLGTKTIKGIRVLQFQGALIFVNAEELLDTMVEMMREKCPGRHKTDSISISVSAEPE
ncbi:sulfate transporter-like isoform X1, partial [Paramuricea clavata]